MTATTLFDQRGAGVSGPKVKFGGRALKIAAHLVEDRKVEIDEQFLLRPFEPSTEASQIQGRPIEPLLLRGREPRLSVPAQSGNTPGRRRQQLGCFPAVTRFRGIGGFPQEPDSLLA